MVHTVIPDALASELQQFAAQTNRDVETVVREAIEQWLERHESARQRATTETHHVSGFVKAADAASLAARLRAIRNQYIAGGGTLLSAAEVRRELAQARGERYPE
ncbi:MAG: ribbon-helix-helix domain-containing protein [Planctomycetes bacterium]|nr:ribbon-helix-helix domain-containing protein [Planctomycetota bacterium]